ELRLALGRVDLHGNDDGGPNQDPVGRLFRHDHRPFLDPVAAAHLRRQNDRAALSDFAGLSHGDRISEYPTFGQTAARRLLDRVLCGSQWSLKSTVTVRKTLTGRPFEVAGR